MANTLTFDQISTVLNSIVQQATGQTAIAATDTSSFVAQANTALLTGYDTLATAISQVLSRTIFSVRPYDSKFGGLRVSNQKYGNHIRKLQMIDKSWENDQRFTLTDGASVDQYVVSKPKVLQTNFYGAQIYQRHDTIYRDQLDQAFSGPDEFASFLAMYLQNARDMIEQAHEQTARMTIANFIGAKAQKQNNYVNLLAEYNDYLGLDGTTGKTRLTIADVYKPENYTAFVRWMYGRILTYSDWLTERTQVYHVNVTGKEISRHTPKRNQRLYIYAPEMNNIRTSALSDIYHDEYLNLGSYESVNFWQSIKTPGSINVTPSYTDTDGTVKKGTAQNLKNIIGVLMDEEAAGYTVVNEWSAPTPFNAAGGYYNQYYHFTDRYWNDLTENAVVFYLADVAGD